YSTRQDQFVFFDAAVEGVNYQVIARLFHDEEPVRNTEHSSAILGFAVDLEWARKEYFSEFTHEMEHLLGNQGATALSLSIIDERGQSITQTRPEQRHALSREKSFPLVFFHS